MQLKITHDIEDNVYSTTITIGSFGTEQLSEEDEKESLNDYPAKIVYRDLVFTKNIEVTNGVPTVTDAEITENNEATVMAVTLPPISNKEIKFDSNFSASYRVDASKVAASAIDADILTSADLVARAYIAVFDSVICDAAAAKIEEVRAKTPAFAEEILVNI